MTMDNTLAIVTTISTFAVFVATVVLAIYTRQLAERTSQPFVTYMMKSSSANSVAMDQTLFNSGTGTAFDIVAKMTPAPPTPSETDDEKRPEVRRLSLLPPGQSISFAGSLSKDIADTKFSVDVSWALKPNGKKRTTLKYETSAFDGFAAGFQVKSIHHVAQELEKIRSLIQAGKTR